MRFVDRVFELKELAAMQALAKKKLFVAALFGLRRVGKTRLLLEFLKGKGIYFFVDKKINAFSLQELQQKPGFAHPSQAKKGSHKQFFLCKCLHGGKFLKLKNPIHKPHISSPTE